MGSRASRTGQRRAGATATAKPAPLQVLAESFSRLGTPVFMADV
ncbi:helicase HerA-like domain-containing protein, partial [Achromobacter insuavis]